MRGQARRDSPSAYFRVFRGKKNKTIQPRKYTEIHEKDALVFFGFLSCISWLKKPRTIRCKGSRPAICLFSICVNLRNLRTLFRGDVHD